MKLDTNCIVDYSLLIMEDFIEIILVILLILAILFTGLLIFLFIKSPIIAYTLSLAIVMSLIAGIGVWARKIYLKRRMGPYYEMFVAISQSRKEIIQSVRKLDRYLRGAIQAQFPGINQLCRETKKCILKIQEIEKVLSSIEATQESENKRYIQQLSGNREITSQIMDSKKRYYENIHAIQLSKNQYIQQIQHTLQFLQELNSQILALRYSHSNPEIGNEVAETIDELLIEIKTLEEII